MKGLWAIIFIMCCFCEVALMGYSYDVKVLRKWQPLSRDYHYWIGYSDFHDKTHKSNTVQRTTIEKWLPTYNPETIRVVVEDLSSPNYEGRIGCGSYFINSRVGILAGLGTFCKENNVPVCNVEYRYCRVVALGPVINNIGLDPMLFPTAKKLNLGHLIEEVEVAYNELLFASQSPGLKKALNQKFLEITKDVKKLQLANDSQKSISEYLAQTTTPMNRLEKVKNLLTFDGSLIGFKIAHASLQAVDKKKVIVFAGGTHINEAYELLQKIEGYEPIKHTNVPGVSPTGIVGSIATPIETGYFGKPAPISIELFEHYLKN